jgi:hypothetical protein
MTENNGETWGVFLILVVCCCSGSNARSQHETKDSVLKFATPIEEILTANSKKLPTNVAFLELFLLTVQQNRWSRIGSWRPTFSHPIPQSPCRFRPSTPLSGSPRGLQSPTPIAGSPGSQQQPTLLVCSPRDVQPATHVLLETVSGLNVGSDSYAYSYYSYYSHF